MEMENKGAEKEKKPKALPCAIHLFHGEQVGESLPTLDEDSAFFSLLW